MARCSSRTSGPTPRRRPKRSNATTRSPRGALPNNLVLASLVLTFALSGVAVVAQPDAPARPAETAPVNEAAPVTVPAPSDTAVSYYRSGNVLWIVNEIWDMGVLLVLLATGLSARLRTWAQRIGRRWFFTVAVYVVFFTVLTFIVDLPLTYYQDFVRE